MKNLATSIIAIGSALFAFGVLGLIYGRNTHGRIEATIGTALIVAGAFIRKDSR